MLHIHVCNGRDYGRAWVVRDVILRAASFSHPSAMDTTFEWDEQQVYSQGSAIVQWLQGDVIFERGMRIERAVLHVVSLVICDDAMCN